MTRRGSLLMETGLLYDFMGIFPRVVDAWKWKVGGGTKIEMNIGKLQNLENSNLHLETLGEGVPHPAKVVGELDLYKSGNELSIDLHKSGDELSLDLYRSSNKSDLDLQ